MMDTKQLLRILLEFIYTSYGISWQTNIQFYRFDFYLTMFIRIYVIYLFYSTKHMGELMYFILFYLRMHFVI
jgi:hypothetical protein